MKVLKLAIATGLITAALGAAPASATDCSNPKQSCGGCQINREMSLENPRPIICYA